MEEKTSSPRPDIAQEILQRPPGWTVRWGSAVITALLAGLVLFSALIRYPDVIPGAAIITTRNPPVRLVAYSGGKVVSVYKKENDPLVKGDRILAIENSAEEKDLAGLRAYLDRMDNSLSGKPDLIPLPGFRMQVGDMQSALDELIASVHGFNTLASDRYYRTQTENLENQIAQYGKLIELNRKQWILSQKELENASQKFQAQKQLYGEGAISRMDFLQEEDAFLQSQKQVQESEKILVQNRITLTDYERQFNDAQFQQENKAREILLSIRQRLNNLRNQLGNWQRSFTVEAPCNGRLALLKPLANGQYIKQGEELFAVIPEEQSYIARVNVSSANAGKIKEGQEVNIRLSDYHFAEYGLIPGRVKTISAISSDDHYRVEVTLPAGLRTTYNNVLDYKPEMNGTAEIVTEEISVLNRLFYRLRGLGGGN